MDEPECQIIFDALLAKESVDRLREIVSTCSSAVFAKCILIRTNKSLEHLKSSVDRYLPIFKQLFAGSQ